ncbi:MAG: outer rane autotransporter [Moraxellaceae bacterium]|jgi:hypothetical protein|nr:outer rane autotransporter [Moraxellaceae bacterium]
MRPNRRSPLKLSLLSCAIASAVAGFSPSALAVDLCTGEAATTVSSSVDTDNCTLDVAGARVTVTGAGALTDGIYMDVDDGIVNNQGTVSQSRYSSSSGNTSAYAIQASTLGASARITNSGVISADATATATGTSNPSASAYGINFQGAVTGSVITNSGRISTTASGESWGGAYGVGSWNGVALDGATIKNTATGRIISEATGDRASAYGIYFSSGGLTNGSTISNSGEITAITHGQDASYASAYGIYQSGNITDSTISNSGTIDATAESTGSEWAGVWGIEAGSLYGDSAVTNSGTITVSASSGSSSASAYGIDIADIYNNATVTNSGKIVATALANSGSALAFGIDLASANDATAIVNSGSITVTGTSISNDAYAYGFDISSMNDTASLANKGSITATANGNSWASAYGIQIDSLNDTSSISNTGTIKATATSLTSSASAWGISFNTMGTGAGITNSGTVSATVTADDWAGAYAVGTDSWGSTLDNAAITNARGAVISAKVDAYSGSAYGIFAPHGMVNGASITNSGAINAEASASGAYASAYGIYHYYDKTDASIVNQGTITATATVDATDWAGAWGIHSSQNNYGTTVIGNSGTIRATATSLSSSASAYGIDTGSVNDTSTVVNSGTIVATAASTGDGSNATSGDLSAYAWGISAGDVNDSASITNSGSITAVATAFGSYASAYGIDAGSVNDTASISNSGTIVARASSVSSSASANGIRFNSVASGASVTNSGRITLEATGSTTGTNWAGAYGLGNWSGGAIDGTLENSGVLTAFAEAGEASAYGMFSNGSSTGATITNSGTIIAQAKGYDGDYASAYGIHGNGSKTDSIVSNSGRIIVAAEAMGDEWAGAYGLYVSGGISGASEVSNSGSISATVSSGEKSASAYGVFSNGLSGTSTMTNSGSIEVRASAATSYVSAYGLYSNGLNDTASITNSGTIHVQADISGTGTGDTAFAVGIHAGSMGAGSTVTNSGTIVAQGSGVNEWIYGIQASGSGAVINSGTIIGGVYLDNSVSLTNSGRIVTSGGSASMVGGDYTQEEDGELTLTLRDTSNYGSLTVNGTADFTASNTVKIAVDPQALLNDGDTFVDVLYASTLTAPDDLDVTDLSVFWDFERVDDGNGFDLVAHQVDTGNVLAGAGVVLTPSQLALVNGAMAGALGADYDPLRGALNTARDAAAAAAVLEQMGPALSGAAAQATRIVGASATRALSARMGETRGASSGDEVAQNGVWIKPFISQAEQDAVNGVSGFDADTTGFVIGLDGAVSDSLRLGVAVASASSEVDSASASVDIRTTQFTLYGSYDAGNNVVLDADLSLGANGFNSSRNVTFANSVAEGNFNGNQMALGLALGKAFAMSDTTTLTPSLSLRYSQVDLDGYTETGAGAFDLTVADSSEDTLLAIAKADYALKLGNKGVFMASLGVGMDTADMASATAQLGGNGPTFVSNGVEPESTLVTGGLGYRYVTAKNLEINAAWDVESRSDFVANTVSVKFKLPL